MEISETISATYTAPTSHLTPNYSIFRRGSRTYFLSSIFFSKESRAKVARLYAFVRVADNYVDQVPAKREQFLALQATVISLLDRGELPPTEVVAPIIPDLPIINSFIHLCQTHDFERSWVYAFLSAMESDLAPQTFSSVEDTIKYMYGSAEVIGLMMCKLMNIPSAAFPAAERLGRAMQYINFLRDIEEDRLLGRVYLPKDEIEMCGLPNLEENSARAFPEQFKIFIEMQAKRYLNWQQEAEDGFHFLPNQFRIPITTASDMYKWTAHKIIEDPMRLFKGKTKPSHALVVSTGLKNWLKLRGQKEPVTE